MQPTPAHPRPGRRAFLLLGAVGGAALVSGCGLDNPFSSTPADEAVRELEPDVGLAVEAVVALRAQIAFAGATAKRFPGLGPEVATSLAVHLTQRDRLVKAVPAHVDTSGTGTAPTIAADRKAAARALTTTEEALQVALDGFALRAESGALARLLGSMAAGTAQITGRALPPPRATSVPLGEAGLDALQQALAGEHAAVFLLGFLGAQASESREPTLFGALSASYRRHKANRDDLVARIADAGGTPVASEVSYALPTALGTARELNDAALQVERRIAQTYGHVVENTAGALRRWALVALNDSAVRQLELRGTPEMFPGSVT